MDYLEPRSPCCFDLLQLKIGTKIILCYKCKNEFELIERPSLAKRMSMEYWT